MPHQPPPGEICIHFYTFGHYYHRTPEIAYPIIKHIECKDLTPPSQKLCAQYTGLDRVLSDSFFSYPANREYYRRQVYSLAETLNAHENENRCLAVTISCRMGMHRSVAMAEKLATGFADRGWKCRVRHLDLEESWARVEAENRRYEREKAGREREKVENERLKREAEDKWRVDAGRHRSEGQKLKDDPASGSPHWGRRMVPTTTTGKATPLACCMEQTPQMAVNGRVDGAPRNYYGKPAPEMIAGFKNTNMGSVPR